MNNFDYMAKFYSWLYKYNKISKDIASEGYKFSDSCNFNDVYCWLKGYSNYPINDFTKKNIERDLLQKKVLTSEIVFLDAITTFFYPYVGNIYDDIDWLLEAASKYQFLIKANNSSDTYYKKYQRIIGLFDKDEQGNEYIADGIAHADRGIVHENVDRIAHEVESDKDKTHADQDRADPLDLVVFRDHFDDEPGKCQHRKDRSDGKTVAARERHDERR